MSFNRLSFLNLNLSGNGKLRRLHVNDNALSGIAFDTILPYFAFRLIVRDKAELIKLLKALAVFRGTSPSLAQAPSSPLRALLPAAGHSYLVAAILAPTEKWAQVDGPQTRILQ